MFKSKVVWITGASGGLGEALAYAFARQGSKLILSARREIELLRVKKNCRLPDNDVLIMPVDLANHSEIPIKVSRVLQRFGAIDFLINNAGVTQRALAAETKFSVDKKLIDTNFLGTITLSKSLLPYFIKNKKGHFVTITSVTGKYGTPLRSTYAATKHGLHGFFDSLRAEHYKDNIKVTIICPGFVRTHLTYNALTGDGTPQNKMDEATGKGLSPEICAEKILSAIRKKKEEAYIGGFREVGGVYLKRFFPVLLSKIIRKAKVV